ncbi:MAG: hypothetical protein Q8M09_08220 [Pseudomonadota bacterium]|nr:hypothetical protein [Pseudomonadota bacterium]MDP1904214.1 hypothetical protein [Pseudomonadota bacterium]
MDWKESFGAWLVANHDALWESLGAWLGAVFEPIGVMITNLAADPDMKGFPVVWMFTAGTIAIAGRYTIRTIKAVRARRFLGIIWNVLMLASVPTAVAWLTLAVASNNMRGPIAWGSLELSLVFCVISLLPAYFYNRWMGEGLQEMMWFPVAPAFMFSVLVGAPAIFIIFVIFFIAMYAYGRSQGYQDGAMLRDYMIDKSRDYYGRKAGRR